MEVHSYWVFDIFTYGDRLKEEKDPSMELPGSREEEQIHLLLAHRDKLLQKIHKEELQITCLDYRIYQIEHKKVLLQENREECEYDNNRKSNF